MRITALPLVCTAVLTATVNAQNQDALVYVPQYSRTHYPSSVVALHRLVRTAVGFLACSTCDV